MGLHRAWTKYVNLRVVKRLMYFIAEQPAPAPHLAHPEECAALRIVLAALRIVQGCDAPRTA